ALKHADPEVAQRAEKCIEAIRSNERVASLVAELGHADPKLRAAAADKLLEMRALAAPAVPALIRLLDDDDLHVRIRATYALGHVGPGARAAIPRLRRLLNDAQADTLLRLSAAKNLANLGPDAECAVPDLLQLLRNEEPRLRSWAASTLRVVGKNHAQVIPA